MINRSCKYIKVQFKSTIIEYFMPVKEMTLDHNYYIFKVMKVPCRSRYHHTIFTMCNEKFLKVFLICDMNLNTPELTVIWTLISV